MREHKVALLAGAYSLAMILGALFFQYVIGVPPCEMCHWQRWPHDGAIVAGLGGALLFYARVIDRDTVKLLAWLALLLIVVTRAVASPEDTEENLAAFAAHGAPEIEALAWQQTPLFLSETPPLAGEEREPPWTLVNRRGGRFITHRLDNRWVTVAEKPFSLSGHLPALRRHCVRWFRADFLWSPPGAVCLPAFWSAVQSGRMAEAVHEGNFLRGLEQRKPLIAQGGRQPVTQ